MLQKSHLVLILAGLVLLWLAQFTGAVAAPQPQGQDVAVITNPTSNAVVSGVVPITGSADYPTFQFYIVEFHSEPVTGDNWQIIGQIHETPVLDGQLETWDTTLTPDGSYTLRLRVVRLDGNYSEAFAQQVVVSNTQPVATDTPASQSVDEDTGLAPIPTVTPTDLPPTPTIAIEQPVVDTPTPRPTETPVPLADPDEGGSLIPAVTGFSLSPLQDACLFGAGVMLSVFLLFGFLAALRTFIIGFIDQWQRKSR